MAASLIPSPALSTLASFDANSTMFASTPQRFELSKLAADTMNKSSSRPPTAGDDKDFDASNPPPQQQRILLRLGRLAERASPPPFCSLRRSITDYSSSPPDRNRQPLRESFPNASTSALGALSGPPPPTYDEYLAELALPRWRGKILPREEEGHEQLPAYSCSIHKEGFFAIKVEMDNPFDPCLNRTWRARYLVLQGTKLEVREPKAGALFVKGDGWKPFALAKKVQYGPGQLLNNFTLQLAEVGMATDYRKRNFVIRLRVQTQQILIACSSVEVQLSWLEALSTAIGLSAPLEDRSFPNYRTVPRRRRHGGRRSPSDTADASAGHPSDDPEPEHRGNRTDACVSNVLDGSTGTIDPTNTESVQRAIEAQIHADVTPTERRRLRSRPDDQAIDPATGKWLPRHHSSPEAHIAYVKRCLPTLLADAPRAHQHIICSDTKMRIWWERKALVADDMFVEFHGAKMEFRRKNGTPLSSRQVKEAEDMRKLEENVIALLF